MGSGWKDFIILIVGTLLGVPASMTASLLLGPAMTIMCGFGIVRALAKLRQRLRRDPIFDGSWMQNWHVSSDTFARENPSSLRIYRFLHLLAAEAAQSTSAGAPYQFRILAVLDRSIITGKWMDPQPNGYYGSFQLILSHTREDAAGKWVGFSSKGNVKTGDWTWKRIHSDPISI
jgi:hypothetical protein